VVAPLPPFAFTMVIIFPRDVSRPGLRRVDVCRTNASSRSVGSRRSLDVFARSRSHRADNELRVRHAADGKHRRIGKFLMQRSIERSAGPAPSEAISTNTTFGVSAWVFRITLSVAAMGRLAWLHTVPRHTGTIHQYLQHRALVIVRGEHGN